MLLTRRSLLVLLSLVLVGLLAACSAPARTEVVRVVETVEVRVEVPVEVTRLVEVPVPANGAAEPAVATLPSAEPTVMPTPLPTLVPTPYPTGQPGDLNDEDFEKLLEIWRIVEREYYGELPADSVVMDAIIQAAVETLNDDFTSYFPPAVAQRINDGFRGDFEGIGAYVDTNDNGEFYIVRPIPNTPASRAGLEPGDVVTAVNGESIRGWTTDEVVAVVRGPRGEAVVLTIVRAGTAEPFEVSIVRDRIVVPQVETQVLADGRIGYVYLTSFNQVATEQLTTAVETLLADGAEALIFDLRYNGGGLLTQSISVGDIFLDRGDFLIVRDSDGNMETYQTESGQIGENVPMVVLINENSASASEIVAGAFRDRERAVLMGTNTFGKGSVQTPYTLNDGSEFRVTTANFYSPADITINRIGVAPDIELTFTADNFGTEQDELIQAAVDYIRANILP